MYDITPNTEKEAEVEQNNKNNNTQKSKSYGCMVTIMTMIIVTVVIVLGLYFFGKKDATNSDVIINEGEQTLFSYSFTFIPKNDITDLQFEISFYDNRTYKSSIKKNIGDVKKGEQYAVTINLTELSFSQAFSSKISIKVSGGKVKLISFS